MSKEELIVFIKENLRINVGEYRSGQYESYYVKIQLVLADEIISEEYFDVPRCDHYCGD